MSSSASRATTPDDPAAALRGGRWAVLGGGTFALWCYSVVYLGVGVIGPAIHEHFDTGLPSVGIALGAVSAGASTSLLLWGILADRIGERLVMAAGLILASLASAAAATAADFATFTILLFLIGLFGASVNAASVRAVVGWFGPGRRGTALGIRQTAVPLGGLAAAVVLPGVSLESALLVVSAVLLIGAVAAGWLVRDPPVEQHADRPRMDGQTRRRVMLISGASILLSTPQVCLVGFVVLFLHDARGVSVAAAAGVFGTIQVIGAALRIGTGWWSDRLGTRDRLLCWMTIALALLVAASAALTSAPLGLLVPALTATGGLALGWNALMATATAESAGLRRTGAAIGFQQTGLAVWATCAAPAFALLVSRSSWRLSLLVVALVAGAAYPLLRRLGADPVAG